MIASYDKLFTDISFFDVRAKPLSGLLIQERFCFQFNLGYNSSSTIGARLVFSYKFYVIKYISRGGLVIHPTDPFELSILSLFCDLVNCGAPDINEEAMHYMAFHLLQENGKKENQSFSPRNNRRTPRQWPYLILPKHTNIKLIKLR